MKKNRRLVIKVGTKVLTSKDRALDSHRLKEIARQISDVKDGGADVLLVTSGAIGAGLWLLGLKKRPADLASLQAAAAIGQSHIMREYSESFKARGYLVAQILLTQEDFNDRTRYINIKHTIEALLANGVIPIINENDTVATDEIRCGDNDRLSGLVADLCQAEKLILLTDVDGLLDSNGNVIRFVSEVSQEIRSLGGKSHCDLGTGGMATKIEAARSAVRAGIDCVIANGATKDIVSKIASGGDFVGTVFASGSRTFAARKRWIAFSSRPKGVVRVDDGAAAALKEKHRSLLASGIIGVEGSFSSGEVVSIAGKDAGEFARGLANYSSSEILKIKGMKTSGYKSVLGSKGADEVVHKDDLVIL
jgi:glutamate 5-kinase